VAEELAEWAKRGASFMVFTYSENDFLFYREFMSSAFAAARKVGLEVWADPWVLAGIFSGETPSWFLLYYPETWQVRVDGRRVPSACLNAPQTLEAVHQWIDAVAAGGAEWVLWDEPHWWYAPGVQYLPKRKEGSSLWTCYCRFCQEKFRKYYHKDMPRQKNEELEAFRRESMRSFLAEVTEYAASRGLKNAVCWAPPEQFPTGLQIEEIVDLETVDKLAIDPYWFSAGKTVENFFVPTVHRALRLCQDRGKPLQVWLQGFRVPRGRESELLQAMNILSQLGIRETAIWYHHEMSALLPEDQEELDRVLKKIFRRFAELKISSGGFL
jgi:hypothetical protein